MFSGKAEPSVDAGPADEIEHHAGGVTLEWFCERRIVCLTPPDASRATIASFFDLVEATIRDWPADRPDLSILDFTSGNVVSTPFARSRAKAAMALRPELPIFTAFVLPPSVQMRLFQLMPRTVFRANSEMAVFTNRADAIAWLKKKGSIG